ncbi:MAG TPA: hypothetical protein PKB15_03455, partial [Acidimicrobiia bacterium]|nr:hypothetical protein [Acidimicrobiia bacterium]
MKYPISFTDLVATVDDDEHATMVVIDAIESRTFSTLELADETAREDILVRVTAWEHYDQYSQLIESQKTFLRQPLPMNITTSELHEVDLLASNALAGNVITILQKDARTKKLYSSISVAASILVIAIGLVAITTYKSADKSQSKTASRSSVLLNKASDSAESNSGSDQSLNAVPDSQNDGAVTYRNGETVPYTMTNKTTSVDRIAYAYSLGSFSSVKSLVKYMKSNDFDDQFEVVLSQSKRTDDTSLSSEFLNCSELNDTPSNALVFMATIASSDDRVFAVTLNPRDRTVNFIV